LGFFAATGVTGATVAANANAPLAFTGPANTVGAFTLASNVVTVTNGGTYLISYTVVVAGTPAATYGLFVNNALVAGSFSGAVGASGAVLTATGSAVVSIQGGQTVAVRNRGSSTDTLGNLVDGQTINPVTLTIMRIN
jgi:hypothetical protein